MGMKKYTQCKIEGCKGLGSPETYKGKTYRYYIGGYCPKHYSRIKKYGDPYHIVYKGNYKDNRYGSWLAMRRRVGNPRHKDYKYYGGRGITACSEWDSFETFCKDMGDKPYGYTLDRIDPDGHYEPSNCRWATRKEQTQNTRKSITLKDAGEIKQMLGKGMTIREVNDSTGISYGIIYNISKGTTWQ